MYLQEIEILEQEIFSLLEKQNISTEKFEEDMKADDKSTTLINNLKSIPGVADGVPLKGKKQLQLLLVNVEI